MRQLQQRRKLLHKVSIPGTLSVPVFTAAVETPTPEPYSLVAAVVHAGASPHAGHYYTVDAAGHWLLNDARASPVGPGFLDSLASVFPQDTPYVLVYARDGAQGEPAPAVDPALAAAVAAEDAAAAARPGGARAASAASIARNNRFGGGGGGYGGGGAGFDSGPRFVM